jgi:cytochrome c553
MKRIAWKIVLSALVVSITPVVAGEQAAGVGNCTWCHGTGAQGYMVAPRLAGQRPLYLLNQIRDFREHTRVLISS